MKKIIVLLISTMLISCTPKPSESDIQTAIAFTQEASSTNTPQPTKTPTATPTPIIYEITYQVTSTIGNWEYVTYTQLKKTDYSNSNLMQISWREGGSLNSCTSAGDKPEECSIPFMLSFNAKEGDVLQITLDSIADIMNAECMIMINNEIISTGSIDGIGIASCEAIASQ